jgi:hypothetical protein
MKKLLLALTLVLPVVVIVGINAQTAMSWNCEDCQAEPDHPDCNPSPCEESPSATETPSPTVTQTPSVTPSPTVPPGDDSNDSESTPSPTTFPNPTWTPTYTPQPQVTWTPTWTPNPGTAFGGEGALRPAIPTSTAFTGPRDVPWELALGLLVMGLFLLGTARYLVRDHDR